MNTSEVLNRAADLIEERGWIQGPDGWFEHGPLCLEGGIAAAIGTDIFRDDVLYSCPAYAAVSEYLGRSPLPVVAPIKDALWQWNDAEGRTASEVVETLRAAALVEAAREIPVTVVTPEAVSV